MKKVAIYARVSTADRNQTVENQLRDLQAVASRMDWIIVATYLDEGVSGPKAETGAPATTSCSRAWPVKEFDLIAAWSICRLAGPYLIWSAFSATSKPEASISTSILKGWTPRSPSGAMIFQLLSVFSSYERVMIRERILSGLRRTSKRSGRKPMADDRVAAIRTSLKDGLGIRATARLHAASPMTVTKIAREMASPEAVAA